MTLKNPGVRVHLGDTQAPPSRGLDTAFACEVGGWTLEGRVVQTEKFLGNFDVFLTPSYMARAGTEGGCCSLVCVCSFIGGGF